jgi:serine protease Do
MRYIFAVLAVLLLSACTKTTEQIVYDVKGGTVLIENKLDTASGGIGTGFILDENMIITNNHVIDGKGTISVYSPNSKKKFAAEVVYADSVSDLAVLKIKDWDKFALEERPVILSLGESDDMNVGEKIIVVGHPWGLKWSVSEGIISAKDRRVGSNPQFVDQVDAHLFEGNSGGPVFNEEGEVVCVSDLMLTGNGGSYGFCIPSKLVKKVLHDFDTLKEVRWRAMNVTIGLTDDESSVIIQSLEPNGAAEKAGLQQGDKILEVITTSKTEGKKIVEVNDVITTFATMPGDEEFVDVIVDRKGQELRFTVKTNYRLSKEYPSNQSK